MFTDIIWRFLILETFVMAASYCACVNEHPQKHFCTSEFVLKAELHEEIKLPMKKAFRMVITKIFKGDTRELNLMDNRFLTLEIPLGCSLDFTTTGDEYLIFGDFKKRNIYTPNCCGSIPWSETTVFYKRALAKYYKKNCDCAPKTKYNTEESCQLRYSFKRKSGKTCKWVKTKYFQVCEVFAILQKRQNQKTNNLTIPKKQNVPQ